MSMKRFFFSFDTLRWNLVMAIGFNLLLLLLRIGLTHSFFYSFLVWNLFLAAIPYGLSRLMIAIDKGYGLRKGLFYAGFASWLLFFPNSPYIITDLVHLHNERSYLLWYDLFLVFIFAINGLLLGVLSLIDMQRLLLDRYSGKATRAILFCCCFLAGYGIYLGRFLRFNSWDALSKPWRLLQQIMQSATDLKTWYITLVFGGFLWILFSLSQSIGSSMVSASNNHD